MKIFVILICIICWLVSGASGFIYWWTTEFDFTTDDFSLAVWIKTDALGWRHLLTRGDFETDGWYFEIGTQGEMRFRTNQAGVVQTTIGTVGDVVTGTWQLISVTRSGAAARIFTNGIDTTATPATHINPLTANRNLYIGVNNLAGAGYYDGDMWRPRIWGRQLSAAEMLQIFETERYLFGV